LVAKISATRESAETTAHPNLLNLFSAEVFPQAIPPVNPTTVFPVKGHIQLSKTVEVNLSKQGCKSDYMRLSSCQFVQRIHNGPFF
jgi:hypothetical protein